MEKDIRTYSPLSLAFLGDAVFELFVRDKIVKSGNAPVNSLHKKSSSIVNAKSQALMLDNIKGNLTDEELDIVRRARNTKMNSMAKHATGGEYRKATGLEALIGYLYLTDKTDRMQEIMEMGLNSIK